MQTLFLHLLLQSLQATTQHAQSLLTWQQHLQGASHSSPFACHKSVSVLVNQAHCQSLAIHHPGLSIRPLAHLNCSYTIGTIT